MSDNFVNSKEECLKNPKLCPYCEDNDTAMQKLDYYLNKSPSYMIVKMECRTCGLTWKLVYMISDIKK